jgi:hypothetical protein
MRTAMGYRLDMSERQVLALTMSDRIVMNDRITGHLGSPRKIYEHPRTRFVAGLIGTCNLLIGTVARVGGDRAVIEMKAEERIIVPLHEASVAAGGNWSSRVRAREERAKHHGTSRRRPLAPRPSPGVAYPGTSTDFAVTATTGARHDHLPAEFGVCPRGGRSRRQRLAAWRRPAFIPGASGLVLRRTDSK